MFRVYLNRGKAARFGLAFLLPALLAAALINPAFNHEGGTILAYLPGGNPLTLESALYGAASAVTLISVINWFSCFNVVMTSDKFIYLSGRALPAASLILSMSLRLVPRFKAQIKEIENARKCIGRGAGSGTPLQRARGGMLILSVMVSWALENSIETADSMKSRGYGLPGRTAFSIYRFGRRDRAALCFLAACAAYIIAGAATGGLYFRYFPTLKGNLTVSVCLVYFALCASPVAINLLEDIKWKAIESKT
jgi:energy-coupling factor transport system permease protein